VPFYNDGGEELAAHRSFVDHGPKKATRVLASGSYTGKPESIPENSPRSNRTSKTACGPNSFAPLQLAAALQFWGEMAGILRRSIVACD
jgi:hypothetical protein